jgi:diguanylate cyclase (GGDEF)-like protein
LVGVAIALSLDGGRGVAEVHPGPLLVGVYDNAPKLFWDQEAEAAAGFFPDILNEIARRERWLIRYVPCEWADCLVALETGELDLMMDVAYSQDRDRRFEFNREVVLASWSVVVARRGVAMNSVLDLDGQRIGVLAQGIQAEALRTTAEEFDLRPELVRADDYQELAQMLQSGAVDGVVVHRFFPIQEQLPMGVKSNILIKPTQLHFAAPSGTHDALLAAIDRQLAIMKEQPNSVYYQAGKRWLKGIDVYQTNWPLLRHGIAIASILMLGSLALLLALWNRSLQREVAKRMLTQAKLHHEVLHDGLTDLPNRHFLITYLESALDQLRAGHSPGFVLLFLDLDRFKVVNDSLGHQTGDQFLVEMARRLSQTENLVIRLGGDEFVILLDHTTDLAVATQTADHILKTLQAPCFLAGHEITIGASIGIVLGSAHYHTPAELIRDADIAMYCAKAKGRNRYAIFDPAMQVEASQKLALENDLRNAVKNQEFVLHYQPLVELRSRQIIGFEALVRWQHPTQGLLPPSHFIPLAEETGLIIPLGWWVLEAACTQLAAWRRQHPHLSALTVSVNVSAAQLRDPQWLPQFDQVLARTGLPGGNLIIEITETLLMKNMDITADLLQQLQTRFVGISIDDFGTGYSSFSYLHQLPITSLKIDRLFIDNLQSTANQENIVKTILVLARQMGLQVTAEGIETEAQMTLLTAMGCDLGQGYWFDRPLPAAEALQRLRWLACSSPDTSGSCKPAQP